MGAEKIAVRLIEESLPEIEVAAKSLLADSGLMLRPASGAGTLKGLHELPSVSRAADAHEVMHSSARQARDLPERLKRALEEASSQPAKAYKVLDLEGRSPAAPSVHWPLPNLKADGWTPGAWLHVNDTPPHAYPFAMSDSGRQALHVSNVPGQWFLGHSNVRIFEVELGSVDQQAWSKLLAGQSLPGEGPIPSTLRDFPAVSVRLIRELGL